MFSIYFYFPMQRYNSNRFAEAIKDLPLFAEPGELYNVFLKDVSYDQKLVDNLSSSNYRELTTFPRGGLLLSQETWEHIELAK